MCVKSVYLSVASCVSEICSAKSTRTNLLLKSRSDMRSRMHLC